MTRGNELLLDRLLLLTALLGDDAERGLEALGLTRTKAQLLWSLARSGAQPQHALARELRVTPRAVTGIVDALAADGHAERRPHPSDRRAVLVALTASGERMMRAMQLEHEQLGNALRDAVAAADREAFDRGLDAVLQRLQQLAGAGS